MEKPITVNPPLKLSQIINQEGKTLVKFNRENMRGFNKEEIEKILKVGICLGCHPGHDRIYLRWRKEISCPKFPHLSIYKKIINSSITAK